MLRTPFLSLPVLALVLAGCSTTRQTEPPRTATEELLISAAVDHALGGLDLAIPRGTRLWVDARDFEGYDHDYAVGAIKDHLLHEGARLAATKGEADAVVELRSGALSIDKDGFLLGIPSIDLPIPLAGPYGTPELPFVKKDQEKGIAKIGMTIYERDTGALAPYSPATPVYGVSDRTRWVVLALIGWTSSDILPDRARR